MKKVFCVLFFCVVIGAFSQSDTTRKWRRGINFQHSAVMYRSIKPFMRFKYSPEFAYGINFQKTKRRGKLFMIETNIGYFSHNVVAPDLHVSNLKYGYSYYTEENFDPAQIKFNEMRLNYLFGEAGFSYHFRLSKRYSLGWGPSLVYYQLSSAKNVKQYDAITHIVFYFMSNRSYTSHYKYYYDEQKTLLFLSVFNTWSINKNIKLGLNIKGNLAAILFPASMDRFPTYNGWCNITPFRYNLLHFNLKYSYYF